MSGSDTPTADEDIPGSSPSPETSPTPAPQPTGGLTPGSRRKLNRERTVSVDTGACGVVSVTVEPQDFGTAGMGGSGGMGEAGGVPIRTNFDGLGPIGGGDGYSDTITASMADTIVTTASELQNAAQNATAGDTIFIPSGLNDAQGGATGGDEDTTSAQAAGDQGETIINLGRSTVTFNQDRITLASDRGVNGSPGAAIRRSSTGGGSSSPAVLLTGESSRVTGLTFAGPRTDRSGGSSDNPPQSAGVRLEAGGCEVDNCEIYGFTIAGVHVANVVTAAVHHNDVHQIMMGSHGWGVRLVQPATGSALGPGGCSPASSEGGGGSGSSSSSLTASTQPLLTDGGEVSGSGGPSWQAQGGGSGTTTTRSIITYNKFNRCENALSADGDGAAFDFKKSLVGSEMFGEGVDVGEPGGSQINIFECTFESTGSNPSIVVRGVPTQGGDVSDNWFHQSQKSLAIRQIEDGDIIADAGRGGFDQLELDGNAFGTGTPARSVGAQQYRRG